MTFENAFQRSFLSSCFLLAGVLVAVIVASGCGSGSNAGGAINPPTGTPTGSNNVPLPTVRSIILTPDKRETRPGDRITINVSVASDSGASTDFSYAIQSGGGTLTRTSNQLVYSPEATIVSDTIMIRVASIQTPTVSASIRVWVSKFGRREMTVPVDASTPRGNYQWEVPVLAAAYLPTQDGIALDSGETGSTASVSAMEERILRSIRSMKFMNEERSRFRGYKNPGANPSLGYRVVAVHFVYDSFKKGFPTYKKDGTFRPDYIDVLDRLGGSTFLEQKGIKEVWLWGYHHGAIEPVESDMSSPTTDDISNSERYPDDLPIIGHTYTLYNFAYGPTNLHNQGHQLEAILGYVSSMDAADPKLFSEKFVGLGPDGFMKGRAGNCHFPPNADRAYDYFNLNPALSDIEDWNPNGGNRKEVSAQTWNSIDFSFPTDLPRQGPDAVVADDAHWYLYWMQNMPGLSNGITFGNSESTNWWEFTGNWDEAIRRGRKLSQPRRQ